MKKFNITIKTLKTTKYFTGLNYDSALTLIKVLDENESITIKRIK